MTRNAATFPIYGNLYIINSSLVAVENADPEAGLVSLLVNLAGRIKGEGTPEAAVFSETQFEADQNGT